MKLFLASSFDKTSDIFKKKFTGELKSKKVIFIANAADTHKGDMWWIKTDRDAFIELGCEIIDTDLRSISADDLSKLIERADIIHFCGGSVLYLNNLIKTRGLDSLIKMSVEKGDIVYTGTSAGSMIVAQDLSLFKFDVEEREYVDVETINDFSGLGLVNFLVIPHANNEAFSSANVEIIKYLPKFSQSLVFVYDNQAVWVEDNKFEILSS